MDSVAVPLPPRKALGGRAFWTRTRSRWLGGGAIVVVLAGWQLLAVYGRVNPLVFSSPVAVVARLYDLFFIHRIIYPDLLASGEEAAVGILLAFVVGVPLGVLMGTFPVVRETLDPLLMALYASPIVAFLPLIIIWFGVGLASKVLFVFFGAVFVFIVNLESGVEGVDRGLLETVHSFGASNWAAFVKVTLPSCLPFLIAAVRLAIGRVLILVFVAEMFAATRGIGYFTMQAGATYDTTDVFVGVAILAATGVILTQALRAVEVRVMRWR